MQKSLRLLLILLGALNPEKRQLGPSAATRKVSHFPLLLRKYNSCSKYSLLTFTKIHSHSTFEFDLLFSQTYFILLAIILLYYAVISAFLIC